LCGFNARIPDENFGIDQPICDAPVKHFCGGQTMRNLLAKIVGVTVVLSDLGIWQFGAGSCQSSQQKSDSSLYHIPIHDRRIIHFSCFWDFAPDVRCGMGFGAARA
jgi:hypothetical protein